MKKCFGAIFRKSVAITITAFLVLFALPTPLVLAYNGPSGVDAENRLYIMLYDHTDVHGDRIDPDYIWQKYGSKQAEYMNNYPGTPIGNEYGGAMFDPIIDRAVNGPEADSTTADNFRSLSTVYEATNIGGTYSQALSQYVSEEAGIRQFTYGAKTIEDFYGVRTTFFGHSENTAAAYLPQILKDFGYIGAMLRTHYQPSGSAPTAPAGISYVNWMGIDGSGIKTIPAYNGDNNGLRPGVGDGMNIGESALLGWGVGGYTGGPNIEHLKRYYDEKKADGVRYVIASIVEDCDIVNTLNILRPQIQAADPNGTKYKIVSAYEMMDILASQSTETNFQPATNDWVLNLMVGIYGNYIAKRNAEISGLINNTEGLVSFGAIAGVSILDYATELENAFKYYLQAESHDSYYGSGLALVERKNQKRAEQLANLIKQEILKRLTPAIRTGHTGPSLVVYNTLGFSRKEPVTHTFNIPEDSHITSIVEASTNLTVPYEVTKVSTSGNQQSVTVSFLPTLKAFSHNTYKVMLESGQQNVTMVSNTNLLNQINSPSGGVVNGKGYTIKFNSNGRIDEIADTYGTKIAVDSLFLQGDFYSISGEGDSAVLGTPSTQVSNLAASAVLEGAVSTRIILSGTIAGRTLYNVVTIYNDSSVIDVKTIIDVDRTVGIGSIFDYKHYLWGEPSFDSRNKRLSVKINTDFKLGGSTYSDTQLQYPLRKSPDYNALTNVTRYTTFIPERYRRTNMFNTITGEDTPVDNYTYNINSKNYIDISDTQGNRGITMFTKGVSGYHYNGNTLSLVLAQSNQYDFLPDIGQFDPSPSLEIAGISVNGNVGWDYRLLPHLQKNDDIFYNIGSETVNIMEMGIAYNQPLTVDVNNGEEQGAYLDQDNTYLKVTAGDTVMLNNIKYLDGKIYARAFEYAGAQGGNISFEINGDHIAHKSYSMDYRREVADKTSITPYMIGTYQLSFKNAKGETVTSPFTLIEDDLSTLDQLVETPTSIKDQPEHTTPGGTYDAAVNLSWHQFTSYYDRDTLQILSSSAVPSIGWGLKGRSNGAKATVETFFQQSHANDPNYMTGNGLPTYWTSEDGLSWNQQQVTMTAAPLKNRSWAIAYEFNFDVPENSKYIMVKWPEKLKINYAFWVSGIKVVGTEQVSSVKHEIYNDNLSTTGNLINTQNTVKNSTEYYSNFHNSGYNAVGMDWAMYTSLYDRDTNIANTSGVTPTAGWNIDNQSGADITVYTYLHIDHVSDPTYMTKQCLPTFYGSQDGATWIELTAAMLRCEDRDTSTWAKAYKFNYFIPQNYNYTMIKWPDKLKYNYSFWVSGIEAMGYNVLAPEKSYMMKDEITNTQKMHASISSILNGYDIVTPPGAGGTDSAIIMNWSHYCSLYSGGGGHSELLPGASAPSVGWKLPVNGDVDVTIQTFFHQSHSENPAYMTGDGLPKIYYSNDAQIWTQANYTLIREQSRDESWAKGYSFTFYEPKDYHYTKIVWPEIMANNMAMYVSGMKVEVSSVKHEIYNDNLSTTGNLINTQNTVKNSTEYYSNFHNSGYNAVGMDWAMYTSLYDRDTNIANTSGVTPTAGWNIDNQSGADITVYTYLHIDHVSDPTYMTKQCLPTFYGSQDGATWIELTAAMLRCEDRDTSTWAKAYKFNYFIPQNYNYTMIKWPDKLKYNYSFWVSGIEAMGYNVLAPEKSYMMKDEITNTQKMHASISSILNGYDIVTPPGAGGTDSAIIMNWSHYCSLYSGGGGHSELLPGASAPSVGWKLPDPIAGDMDVKIQTFFHQAHSENPAYMSCDGLPKIYYSNDAQVWTQVNYTLIREQSRDASWAKGYSFTYHVPQGYHYTKIVWPEIMANNMAMYISRLLVKGIAYQPETEKMIVYGDSLQTLDKVFHASSNDLITTGVDHAIIRPNSWSVSMNVDNFYQRYDCDINRENAILKEGAVAPEIAWEIPNVNGVEVTFDVCLHVKYFEDTSYLTADGLPSFYYSKDCITWTMANTLFQSNDVYTISWSRSTKFIINVPKSYNYVKMVWPNRMPISYGVFMNDLIVRTNFNDVQYYETELLLDNINSKDKLSQTASSMIEGSVLEDYGYDGSKAINMDFTTFINNYDYQSGYTDISLKPTGSVPYIGWEVSSNTRMQIIADIILHQDHVASYMTADGTPYLMVSTDGTFWTKAVAQLKAVPERNNDWKRGYTMTTCVTSDVKFVKVMWPKTSCSMSGFWVDNFTVETFGPLCQTPYTEKVIG